MKEKKNLGEIIGEIKSLIYKYYSNLIICFENNDIFHKGQIDFDRYKNIIYDMYNRDEKEIPNFTLIKNSFDAIDIRKDGIIDRIEWSRAFASYNGKLDFKKEYVSNGFEFFDKKIKIYGILKKLIKFLIIGNSSEIGKHQVMLVIYINILIKTENY